MQCWPWSNKQTLNLPKPVIPFVHKTKKYSGIDVNTIVQYLLMFIDIKGKLFFVAEQNTENNVMMGGQGEWRRGSKTMRNKPKIISCYFQTQWQKINCKDWIFLPCLKLYSCKTCDLKIKKIKRTTTVHRLGNVDQTNMTTLFD